MDSQFNKKFVEAQVRAMKIKLDELEELSKAPNPDWAQMKNKQQEMDKFYFGLFNFLTDRVLHDSLSAQRKRF